MHVIMSLVSVKAAYLFKYLNLNLVLLHHGDDALLHHLCLPHLLPLLQVGLQRSQGFVFLQVLLLEQHGSNGQDDLVVGILGCSLPLPIRAILIEAVQCSWVLFQNPF